MRRPYDHLLATCTAVLLAALVPALARAETRTFVNLQGVAPSQGAGSFGPANIYPSTIVVSGVPGTISHVSVTMIELASANADDIDMALVGPDEEVVMLMSDACGDNGLTGEDWTFDDSAGTFLSDNGPCAPAQHGSFKPSNYEDPALDDLTLGGGPAGPYLNSLSSLANGSPDGSWKLFLTDDHVGVLGFETGGWTLTLEIEPPPPPPPVLVPTLTPTATAPATPVTTPIAPVTTPSAKTGRRAAALKRCKTKKTSKARLACRRKAHKLPV
jgi:hypothetical protein